MEDKQLCSWKSVKYSHNDSTPIRASSQDHKNLLHMDTLTRHTQDGAFEHVLSVVFSPFLEYRLVLWIVNQMHDQSA